MYTALIDPQAKIQEPQITFTLFTLLPPPTTFQTSQWYPILLCLLQVFARRGGCCVSTARNGRIGVIVRRREKIMGIWECFRTQENLARGMYIEILQRLNQSQLTFTSYTLNYHIKGRYEASNPWPQNKQTGTRGQRGNMKCRYYTRNHPH